MRQRVFQGRLATGALVIFHSYLLPLRLWGVTEATPAPGENVHVLGVTAVRDHLFCPISGAC
jgi:hypothetical protein